MTVVLLGLVFASHHIVVEALTSINFEAVTSLNGEKLCINAKPMKMEMNVRSIIQCGTICNANEFCQTYGYKSDLKQCYLYDSSAPQNYSVVPGCSSYILQGEFSFPHSA